MKKTLLKFSSLIYLIAFRRYAKAKEWEIDLTALTVLCDCSAKETRVACKEFKAVVLREQEAFGKNHKETGTNTPMQIPSTDLSMRTAS